MIRKIIFWVHLAAGCVAGLVILVVAVSGIMIAFRPQITRLAERGFHSIRPTATSTHLPVESILAAASDGMPTALTIRSEADAPAEITMGRDRTLLVDVYSGRPLGAGSPGVRGFFQKVEGVHRWLALDRNVGKPITGTSSMLFLAIVVSGPFLWMPRKWNWKNVRAVGLFRGGLKGKAREFNWHNVIGIWCTPTLFVLVSCGVVMSHDWASNLIYRMAGEQPPVQKGERRGRPGAEAPAFAGMNAAWDRAEQQVPGWKTISMRVPTSGRAPLTFTIDTSNGGRPDRRSQLTLDARTAQIMRWETFSSGSTGKKINSFVRYIHTGEAGGIVGQTLSALTAAGAVMLVWTGLFMAMRRFLSWRKRAKTERERVPEPATLQMR